MTSDGDNTTDHTAGPVRHALNQAADAATAVVDDLGPVVTVTLEKARTLAREGWEKVRAAYDNNPTRTVTLGVLYLAALIAILTTLTRRG